MAERPTAAMIGSELRFFYVPLSLYTIKQLLPGTGCTYLRYRVSKITGKTSKNCYYSLVSYRGVTMGLIWSVIPFLIEIRHSAMIRKIHTMFLYVKLAII